MICKVSIKLPLKKKRETNTQRGKKALKHTALDASVKFQNSSHHAVAGDGGALTSPLGLPIVDCGLGWDPTDSWQKVLVNLQLLFLQTHCSYHRQFHHQHQTNKNHHL